MRIYSYAQFKALVGGFPRSGRYLFRGIGSQFRLIPSIAYQGETDTKALIQQAQRAQQRFNEEVIRGEFAPELSPYQLSFLGRHAGLISPYMDFTFNDTIAIQFGMEAAGDNPVYLYVMDINGQQVYAEGDRPMEAVGLRIYRPNLVWRENGFLTPERTQAIQNARLIAQNANTIATPFDATYGDRLVRYEIHPENFPDFKREILGEGIRMETDLLINPDDPLFQIASRINKED